MSELRQGVEPDRVKEFQDLAVAELAETQKGYHLAAQALHVAAAQVYAPLALSEANRA